MRSLHTGTSLSDSNPCKPVFTIPDFPIKTEALMGEFYRFESVLRFYRKGWRGVVEKAFEISLRMGRDYQPPTYCEYEGLEGLVTRELELFLDRPQSNTEYKNYLNSDEGWQAVKMAVDTIEANVELLVSQCLPESTVELSHPHWVGDALFVRLKIE